MSAPKETSMASPFAPKLGTNYCPLDDEVLQIRALLKAPLSRSKQIDDQIAELQKAIDELVEERERVRSFVDPHQDLISPFRRLPLDVVQEIFVACLPTHRNCVMSALEAPVLLGRICSTWRSISLGTPRLWARLHIVEPSRSRTWSSDAVLEEKVAQRLETTKAWLGRSGHCPLSISFQVDPGQEDPAQPGVAGSLAKTHLFMDVIVSVAPRWEDITLRTPSSALEPLSSLTEHDVPILQKFEMSTSSGSPLKGASIFALLSAPRLKDFTFPAAQNFRELPVRWGNLTHLSAAGFGDGSFSSLGVFELLAKCSQLRECRLYLSQLHGSSSPPDGSASSSIQLPFLHSFHISSFDLPVEDIRNIFRRLSLPKLRHLGIHGRLDLDFTLQNFPLVGVLLAFLAVSSCFESLSMDTQQFRSTGALVELFRGLPPTTTSLRIVDRLHSWSFMDEGGILDDAAIAVLTPTPENPGSCPALQELIITRCKAPSDAALLKFLKARLAVPASALRKVKIKFHRLSEFDIFPDIQRILDDGRIEVSTIYRPPKTAGAFSPWEGLPDAPETNGTQDESDPDFV